MVSLEQIKNENTKIQKDQAQVLAMLKKNLSDKEFNTLFNADTIIAGMLMDYIVRLNYKAKVMLFEQLREDLEEYQEVPEQETESEDDDDEEDN
jgi:hypothetical protein